MREYRNWSIALLEKNVMIHMFEIYNNAPQFEGHCWHSWDTIQGVNDYRLEFDAEGLTWTLVALREGHDARD